MNTKKHNFFKRVLAVQEVYNLYKQEGLNDVYIYREYIYNVFHISERTYWKYLGINAKREIKLIDEEKKRLEQLKADAS